MKFNDKLAKAEDKAFLACQEKAILVGVMQDILMEDTYWTIIHKANDEFQEFLNEHNRIAGKI